MNTNSMSSALRKLSDQELKLHWRVEALCGTIEAKHAQLVASDIGAAYRQVHHEYYQLATGSADAATRLEALKRLVFLSWQLLVEPAIYSGLSYYDEVLVRDSYALLDAYLTSNQSFDSELFWMLHSYATWYDDDLLPRVTGLRLPALTAFIAAKDPEVYLVPERQLPAHTMDHRGRMGLYWRSRQVEMADYRLPGQ